MSYTRIIPDLESDKNQCVDFPLLYEYMTMSVENAESPTMVPLLVSALLLPPMVIGIDKITDIIGRFFQPAHHHHKRRAFLDMDGVDDNCDNCSYR
jgi:hypothetical protein